MKFHELTQSIQESKNATKDMELEFRTDVANLITEARLYSHLTQKDLAKKVGTHQPSIARVESGGALPSLQFLLKIAKALGTYLIAPKFGFMENTRTDNKTSYAAMHVVYTSTSLPRVKTDSSYIGSTYSDDLEYARGKTQRKALV